MDPHPRGIPEHLARCEHSLVMGVVNVTPDSFSDGGRHLAPDAAVAHGRSLLAEGAHLLDIGGESTRPGAQRVDPTEEIDRIRPVIRELAADGAVISVDTMRAETARAAVDAGAGIVNDVSGGLADPDMAATVAALRGPHGPVPYIAMHWRGHSDVMDDLACYDDVVTEVTRELGARVDALLTAGLDPARIVLDPGLGFAKTADQNWELLTGLDTLASLGRPLLVAGSRKRFLAELGGDRDHATAALAAHSAEHGAWAVRVHDVPGALAAVRVGGRLRSAHLARARRGTRPPRQERIT
ncbi:MAG: dihydropteroate synthase [Brachybacterium sp.]|nr:dihydropteroate synthase [Brachybacterium sp.]